MDTELNRFQKIGYKTGINYVDALRRLMERNNCDLQTALDIAIQDLCEEDAYELIEGTLEAYRFLTDYPGELNE